MADLVRCELERSSWRAMYPSDNALLHDARRLMDWRGTDGLEGARRLAVIRSPVLVVQSADDPLRSAQPIADLFARTDNPNCGLIVLAEGGHGGLISFCAPYLYGMIRTFFDPATAPTGIVPRPRALQVK